MEEDKTINERLMQIMEHEALTPASFARRTGIGDQTVRSVIIIKRNKPGFDFIVRVVQTFDWLSSTWLLTGKGSMIRSENPADDEDSAVKNAECLVNYLKEKDTRIEQLLKENTALRMLYAERAGSLESLLERIFKAGNQ